MRSNRRVWFMLSTAAGLFANLGAASAAKPAGGDGALDRLCNEFKEGQGFGVPAIPAPVAVSTSVSLGRFEVLAPASKVIRAIAEELRANPSCKQDYFRVGERLRCHVPGFDFYAFEAAWSCEEKPEGAKLWVTYSAAGAIRVAEKEAPSPEAGNFKISELRVLVQPSEVPVARRLLEKCRDPRE